MPNNKTYHRFPIVIRIISVILIAAFLAQDITWACPDLFERRVSQNNDKLAPPSLFKEPAKESIDKVHAALIYHEIEKQRERTGIAAGALSLKAVKAVLERFNGQPWLQYAESDDEIIINFPYGHTLKYYYPDKLKTSLQVQYIQARALAEPDRPSQKQIGLSSNKNGNFSFGEGVFLRHELCNNMIAFHDLTIVRKGTHYFKEFYERAIPFEKDSSYNRKIIKAIRLLKSKSVKAGCRMLICGLLALMISIVMTGSLLVSYKFTLSLLPFFTLIPSDIFLIWIAYKEFMEFKAGIAYYERAVRLEKDTTIILIDMPGHLIMSGEEDGEKIFYQLTHLGRQRHIVFIPKNTLQEFNESDINDIKRLATILNHDQIELDLMQKEASSDSKKTYAEYEKLLTKYHEVAKKDDPFGIMNDIEFYVKRWMRFDKSIVDSIKKEADEKAAVCDRQYELIVDGRQGIPSDIYDTACMAMQLKHAYSLTGNKEKAKKYGDIAWILFQDVVSIDNFQLPFYAQLNIIRNHILEGDYIEASKKFTDIIRYRVGILAPSEKYVIGEFSNIENFIVENIQKWLNDIAEIMLQHAETSDDVEGLIRANRIIEGLELRVKIFLEEEEAIRRKIGVEEMSLHLLESELRLAVYGGKTKPYTASLISNELKRRRRIITPDLQKLLDDAEKVIKEGYGPGKKNSSGQIARGDAKKLFDEYIKQEQRPLRGAIDKAKLVGSFKKLVGNTTGITDEARAKIYSRIDRFTDVNLIESDSIILRDETDRNKTRGWLLGFNTMPRAPNAQVDEPLNTPQKFLQEKFPNTIDLSTQVLDEIESTDGNLQDSKLFLEYLFHEMICPAFGHIEARKLQEIIFNGNYEAAKGKAGHKDGRLTLLLKKHIAQSSEEIFMGESDSFKLDIGSKYRIQIPQFMTTRNVCDRTFYLEASTEENYQAVYIYPTAGPGNNRVSVNTDAGGRLVLPKRFRGIFSDKVVLAGAGDHMILCNVKEWKRIRRDIEKILWEILRIRGEVSVPPVKKTQKSMRLDEYLNDPGIKEIIKTVKGETTAEEARIRALEQVFTAILTYKGGDVALKDVLDNFESWAKEANKGQLSRRYGLQELVDNFRRQLDSAGDPSIFRHPVYKALVRYVRGWRKQDAHCHVTKSLHEGFLYEELRTSDELRGSFRADLERKLNDEEIAQLKVKQPESFTRISQIREPKLNDLTAEEIATVLNRVDFGAAKKKLIEVLEKTGGMPWDKIDENIKQDTYKLFRSLPLNVRGLIRFREYGKDIEFRIRCLRHVTRQHFFDGSRQIYIRLNPFGYNSEESLLEYLRRLDATLKEEEGRADKVFGGSHKVFIVLVFPRKDFGVRNSNTSDLWRGWEENAVRAIKDMRAALEKIGSEDFRGRFYGIDIASRELLFSVEMAEAIKNIFDSARQNGFNHLFMHLGDNGNLGNGLEKMSGEPDAQHYLSAHLDSVLKTLIYLKDEGVNIERIAHGFVLAPQGSKIVTGPGKGSVLNVENLAIADEAIEFLKSNGIGIEVCLIGGIGTYDVEAFKYHPAHQWLKRGIGIFFGVDGHWGRAPRTLSNDIVQFLLTEPGLIIEQLREMAAPRSVYTASPKSGKTVTVTEAILTESFRRFAKTCREEMKNIKEITKREDISSQDVKNKIGKALNAIKQSMDENFGGNKFVHFRDSIKDAMTDYVAIDFVVYMKNPDRSVIFGLLERLEAAICQLEKLADAGRLSDIEKARERSGVIDASRVLTANGRSSISRILKGKTLQSILFPILCCLSFLIMGMTPAPLAMQGGLTWSELGSLIIFIGEMGAIIASLIFILHDPDGLKKFIGIISIPTIMLGSLFVTPDMVREGGPVVLFLALVIAYIVKIAYNAGSDDLKCVIPLPLLAGSLSAVSGTETVLSENLGFLIWVTSVVFMVNLIAFTIRSFIGSGLRGGPLDKTLNIVHSDEFAERQAAALFRFMVNENGLLLPVTVPITTLEDEDAATPVLPVVTPPTVQEIDATLPVNLPKLDTPKVGRNEYPAAQAVTPPTEDEMPQYAQLPAIDELIDMHAKTRELVKTKMHEKGFKIYLSENLFRKDDAANSLKPIFADAGDIIEIASPEKIRAISTNRDTVPGKIGCIVTKEDFSRQWGAASTRTYNKATLLAVDVDADDASQDKDLAYIYLEGLMNLVCAMADKDNGAVTNYINMLFDVNQVTMEALEEYLKDNNSMKFALSAILKLKPLDRLDTKRFDDYKRNTDRLLRDA